MDVHVRRAVAHRPDELRELTGRDATVRRADDVRRVDDAGHRATAERAHGLVTAAAQECRDRAVDVRPSEVDVGEQRV